MSTSKLSATLVQSAVCKIGSYLRRPHPSMFYYPGLSSPAPVVPNRLFPELTETLKSAYPSIMDEYKALRKKQAMSGTSEGASDYKETNEHKKLHSGDWAWQSYVQKGKRSTDFAVQCPRTCEALESLPNFMTGTPFSFAFFSTLGKGASIAAHTGPCNLRLRVHFPLIVPAGDCGMQIGEADVTWREGEPVIFDDAYLHRVWNNGEGDRVVLLFDVWHPELYPDEIEAIQELFADQQKQNELRNDMIP